MDFCNKDELMKRIFETGTANRNENKQKSKTNNKYILIPETKANKIHTKINTTFLPLSLSLSIYEKLFGLHFFCTLR